MAAFLGVALFQNLVLLGIIEVVSWQTKIESDSWGMTIVILSFATNCLVLAPSISYILFFYMPLCHGLIILVNFRYDLPKK